jgi:thiol-disulfide isomerase/thioredoxin
MPIRLRMREEYRMGCVTDLGGRLVGYGVRIRSVSLGLLAALTLGGCKGQDGIALLKHSMDAYKDAKGFTATCDWSFDSGDQAPQQARRVLAFEAPNHFNFQVKGKNGATLASVCDGENLLESSSRESGAMRYNAPPSLNDLNSLQMRHPLFAGSILYKFVGGGSHLDDVVDLAQGPIKVESAGNKGGEQASKLSFYATGSYGNTQITIGNDSGKVYEIRTDNEPVVQQVKKEHEGDTTKLRFDIDEVYSDVTFNPASQPGEFTLDKKMLADAKDADPTGGLKAGMVAPNFKVVSAADGKELTLASMKGKYVLVDFWATWCGPCKESLPHTESIYKKFKDKGLQVIAVSTEGKDKITPFWKDAGYTIPVYSDPGANTTRAYKADAIPDLVLINPEGKIAFYLIGLRDEGEVLAELAKAGIQ